jgi:glycosyltransferase involved in cell wall biosynthesis
MEKPLPFVSVVVPVFNAESMIGDCIESLLNQDYPKDRYEIIIVNNDSTDGTAEVIRRYPVKYAEERELHTPFAAEDTGIRASRGELLAFCDSDETATPSWVRTLVREMRDGCGAVAGPMLPAPHEKGLFMLYAAADANGNNFTEAGDIDIAASGNLMFRREVYEKLGGYNRKMFTGADLELTRRVHSELGLKLRFTPDAVVYHRPRTSLKNLLKHEARNGYAGAWLQRDRPKSLAQVLWQTLARLVHHVGALAAALVLFWRGSPRRRLFFTGMNILMLMANLYGKLYYRFGGTKCPGIGEQRS